MHLAPVVVIAHAGGPDQWVGTLARLVAVAPAGLPLTVRAPGAAIEHVWKAEPELADALATRPWSWLSGGWSEPVLADLPPDMRLLQLSREQSVLDAASISPVGLWAGDAWEPALVTLAREQGSAFVYLDATTIPDTSPPGPIERAGEAVIGVPVSDGVPDLDPDALAAVRIEAHSLADLVSHHRGHFTTVHDFVAVHPLGPRLTPATTAPAREPETERFYHKLLLVSRNQPERAGGLDEVSVLQSREHTTAGGGGPEAERLLVAARSKLDSLRHRGDSWVEMSETDWDADGVMEIHVETATTSLVVDPATGSIDVWDDKAGSWPVLATVPALPAVICRRMTAAGSEPRPETLRLVSTTTGRAEARLVLLGDEGGRCELLLTRRDLHVEVNLPAITAGRTGIELPVSMHEPGLRVDGGTWHSTGEPVALSGHRFRLTDDIRTLVLSSPQPAEMFCRPLAGNGVLVWLHWPTEGESQYRITISPS